MIIAMVTFKMVSIFLSLIVLLTPAVAQNCTTSRLATIPRNAPCPQQRNSTLVDKRAGWTYTPGLLNGPYSPGGSLGSLRVKQDVNQYFTDYAPVNASLYKDLAVISQALNVNGGLNSLADYTNVLYNNEWKNVLPDGVESGLLTNYTQDLLFSMERLSLNPYSLKRVKPNDYLPFTIDDSLTRVIANSTFAALKGGSRLFIVDYSDQANYAKTSRYGAACTALFFIHPNNGLFLPLAVKTNVGANLVYTPLDSDVDWLFAKMAFNSNDLFHSELYHLLATHEVGEIVYLAAERTLSDEHPIMALMDRLMSGSFALRVIGTSVLFNPGGLFDQAFHTNSSGALSWAADTYKAGGGSWSSNYLDNDLKARGLINYSNGPAFKSFPFYEDAKTLRNTVKDFMTTFVKTYYNTDSNIHDDAELQAFFREATSPSLASVQDWPCTGAPHGPNRCGKTQLVEILTHFAYLMGISHHALNTGSLPSAQGTLPFHTMAFYQPLPTTKNLTTTQLLALLPPTSAALFQVTLVSGFNRPYFEAANRTLAYAYSDPTFLSRFPAAIATAAEKYKGKMLGFSKKVRGRTFGKDGLWNGMPFVWKSLDPGTIPWFFAI